MEENKGEEKTGEKRRGGGGKGKGIALASLAALLE